MLVKLLQILILKHEKLSIGYTLLILILIFVITPWYVYNYSL
jgi:hypothetical protein